MTRDAFLVRFSGIYEHSPWVAEAAWDQGLDGSDPVALVDPMRFIVENAGQDRQITLLRAHPDLAGKLSLADLTDDSASEQTGAGLDQCSPEELTEFQRLNEGYKDRFRFPFILAVKGHDRSSILEQFRRRVGNTPDSEFREALNQVHKIARFRLEEIAGKTP